jgi:hypothetical protein
MTNLSSSESGVADGDVIPSSEREGEGVADEEPLLDSRVQNGRGRAVATSITCKRPLPVLVT